MWQLVSDGSDLATLQYGSVKILARSTVISVMNEIKSEETQRVIDSISKQYYGGEYDPEEEYDEEYYAYEEEEGYEGMPWGFGQNGEQWSSDI